MFIGDGAKIMPGVKSGEGAIIVSNAVEKYTVVAGIPAI